MVDAAGYVLGIDLGTTFTAAAVGRGGVVGMATLGTRAAAMPSVLLFRPDGVLAGDAAEERARTEPERVARLIKRRLGDTVPVLVDGQPYSPESLLATLLRWVLAQVERTEGGPPATIAVCHPANWGPYKLELFGQALAQAGMADAVLVPEPIAAAVAYAATRPLAEGDTVAVYDLGGGTFDASVVRRTVEGYRLLGPAGGVEHLGGIDIDAAVFEHVARNLGGALERLDEDDPAAQSAVARLREDCIRAKEVLSSDTEAVVPVILPGVTTEVRITRAELERMIRPMLGESVEALRRALDGAGVTPASLRSVLLVGGSSRIPLVAELVTAEFGVPVAVDVHPKHATAIGAVVVASGTGTGTGAGTGAPAPAAAPPPPPAPPSAPPPAADLDAAVPAPPATAELVPPVAPPVAVPPAAPPPGVPGGAHPWVPPEPGPAPVGGRRAGSKVLVAVVAVLALVAAAFVGFTVLGGEEAAEAEVFAEPIASAGVDPFTGSVVPSMSSGGPIEVVGALEPAEGEASGFALPTVGVGVAEEGVTPQVSGAAPGLYGGTNQTAVCDKAQLVAFLTDPANTAKAQAWAGVLGIAAAEIPAYVAGLTDVVLQRDTRVTNHGFRDGRATSFQSVLQAGSAVLVDARGVPRVRCACGNPLTPPTPLPSREPEVRGVTWPGFDLTQVIVIAAAPEPVQVFELDDLLSDARLLRAVGADPLLDEVVGAATATTAPPPAEDTTTTTVRLGTGDVQVTLRWSTDADLDLYVVDPSGFQISFGSPESPSGGRLDVDNIPQPGDTSEHVENIFWPTGEAPAGDYATYVVAYTGESSAYRLEVRIGGVVVATEDGVVDPSAPTTAIPFTSG